MGFSGLESSGTSDAASDCKFTVIQAVTEILKKEMAAFHSGWNTPGYVNVAFIFEELIVPSGTSPDEWFNEDLFAVAESCHSHLSTVIEQLTPVADKDFRSNLIRLRGAVSRYVDHYKENELAWTRRHP